MSRRVLFIDRVHPAMAEALTAKGFDCEEDFHSTGDELKMKIGGYTGVVIRSRIPFDAEMIAAAGNLKFIARSGSGLENIDLEAAKRAGVAVYNSPEGNRDAVGEHAIGMLLALFNKLIRADAEVRIGIWKREENRGLELAGKTVGIIGYGQMGSAFAEKLTGFGCDIVAWDKYKKDYAPPFVREVSLEELKTKADIISIHLPLSRETHHYVGKNFIDGCGKPFYLINTARGQHVDTEALLDGLESGKILGACLDVLEFEKSSFEILSFDDMPEIFKDLSRREDVIFSPHVAGWTRESYLKLATKLAEKIGEGV